MTISMSVIVIGGVFAIIGICVMSHYRGKSAYDRVFMSRSPIRHRRTAGESGNDGFALYPMTINAGTEATHHSYDASHGAVDCGSSHAADGGGGCSVDGGGGGH